MTAYTNVADAAERTFNLLKPLNKRLKAAWFADVADDLVAVRSARGVQP